MEYIYNTARSLLEYGIRPIYLQRHHEDIVEANQAIVEN